MQVQHYIRTAQASGLSNDQITHNLIQAGWPKEQIERAFGNYPPLAARPLPHGKTSSQQIMVMAGVIMIFLIFLLPLVKFVATSNTLVNRKYGFEFSNLSGWRKIPPIDGSDISLESKPTWNISFSVANVGIRAEPNQYMMGKIPEKEIRSTYISQCQSTAEASKYEYLGTETIDIADTFTLRCRFEGKIQNKNANIIVQDNYYIVKKKYNLLLSASYRKDFPQGELLIKQLIDGFRVLND